MIITYIKYLLSLLILIFMIMNGCGKKDSDDLETQIKNETYEEVNPSELKFGLKDYHYDGVIIEGGGVKPIAGNIGELICKGNSLELSSKKFDDGFVNTKNYGKIKITFGNSLYGESFAVHLTPTQKKLLDELKKGKEQSVKEEPEYKPVPYAEILFAFKNHDYKKGEVLPNGIIPDGGKVGEFYCALGNKTGQTDFSKKIELSSDNFENGFVNTRDYGRIKVIFIQSDGQHKHVVLLTDKQKAEIIEFLKL